MASEFPTCYRPAEFHGRRFKQYTNREDAFQQLVGDALFASAGPGVFVATTKGKDGAIDAALDERCALPGLFTGLSLPLIVECKDNDEELAEVAKNIKQAWTKLAKTLKDKAEAGWPGLYAPWKSARSYVFCTSSSLPSLSFRDELSAQILDFFQSLPPSQRPPIEQVLVVGWAELRAWFMDIPRLTDAWVGIGFSSLKTHAEFVDALDGSKKYLLNSELAFVPPPPDDPNHPDNIYRQISNNANRRGILLAGAGGVGKSRTALEVASRADADGWRVIHVLPDEPVVTVEELADCVLNGHGKTMLVFDYLDQMQDLSLAAIRRNLLPEATKRGIDVTLLANSRPGWLLNDPAGLGELLDIQKLEPSPDQSEHIVDAIIRRVSPTAASRIPWDELKRICGHRPIIALFIAHELENRLVSGALDMSQLGQIRSGDLADWLKRRLNQDGFSAPKRSSPLLPGKQEPEFVAAAAALACAPDSRDALIATVEATMAEMGQDEPESTAEYIVAMLLTMGWLDEDGFDIRAAHDVVADEVLERTIMSNSLIRKREFAAILTGGTKRARGFGRLAISLNRLVGAVSETGTSQSISQFASEWLRISAVELGFVLASHGSDEASFALGAVFAGPPWKVAASESWGTLIQPWLNARGVEVAARHCIYRGLSALPEGQAGHLTDIALRWLTYHHPRDDAGFVIAPLLSRADMTQEATASATAFALKWLAKYGEREAARFVLDALLSRTDLPEEATAPALAFALEWLAKHWEREDAGFVIAPLLSRSDMTQEATASATAFALKWLAKYGEREAARFVLAPLLSRTDLPEEATAPALAFALEWLAKHWEREDAGFVLAPLLSRTDLPEEATAPALAFALQWLARLGEREAAQFVLTALLSRSDLPQEATVTATTFALQWLARLGEREAAQFVLTALLSRSDLPQEATVTATTFALQWLARLGEREAAQFVLDALLSRTDLPEEATAPALAFALEWLAKHWEREDAGFVLAPLLSRANLPQEATVTATAFAFKWLAKHGERQDADFVLRSLLSRANLPQEATVTATAFAFKWLAKHGERQDADFVLRSLLSRGDLAPHESAWTIECALKWLARNKSRHDSGFILRSLLSYVDLSQDNGIVTVDLALDWLDIHVAHDYTDYVYNKLLRHAVIADAKWVRAAVHATTWLRANKGAYRDRDYTLNSLLRRPLLLSPRDVAYAATELLAWTATSRGLRKDVVRRNCRSLSSALEAFSEGDPMRTLVETEIATLIYKLESLDADAQSHRSPAPPDSYREALLALANSGDHVPVEVIQSARAEIDRRAEMSLGRAGSLLVPLVAIGVRTTGETLEAVRAAAAVVLTNERLEPRQRAGIGKACRRLFQELAIADQPAAIELLDELGLAEAG